MRRKSAPVLIFLLFFVGVYSSSVHSLVLTNEHSAKSFQLAPHVDFYIDNDGLLTLDDILSPAVSDQFIPNESRVPNLGFSGAAGWYRIVIESHDKRQVNWLLEIAFPLAEEVSFFHPLGGGQYKEIKTGMDYPFSSRVIDHPNYVFPLGNLNKEKTFYLRMRCANGALQMPLVVWEETLFLDYEKRSLVVWGGMFGIIFVMCIYNLFIFLSVRDKAYLYYILYAASMAGSVLVLNGLGFQYFWMDYPGWNDRVVAFTVGTSTFFAIGFCRLFNSTDQYTPRLDQYLRLLSYASLLISVLALTIDYNLSLVSTLFVMLFSLSMLVAGVHSVRTGVRSSKYFLVAWLAFIAGLLIYTLSLLDVIPANFISVHGKEIGAISEMILLSLGLADRINVEKEERLGALSMLARSEERYRSIFEKAVEGRFQLNKYLRIIEYNASFMGILGYDNKAVLPEDLFGSIWAEQDSYNEFINMFEHREQVDSFPCLMRRNNEELFDAEISIAKDLDHRGEVFFYGAISDVSEKKQIDELVRKQLHAEEVSQAKSIFLATMSHELRRPINTIYGFSQLIREEDVGLSELKAFNQRIYTSATVMKDVVNNILDFSKIESGVLEVNNRPFNLSLLIDVIMETCLSRAGERQIEFNVVQSDDLPKDIVGDEYHLRQVLINLVDNGIKFTTEGSVDLIVTHARGPANSIRLRFEVRDTGVGMSESFLKNIFKQFSQEANESYSGGTGLGMYVAKEYVRVLGGDLKVSSELGRGSCFHFEAMFDVVNTIVPSSEDKLVSGLVLERKEQSGQAPGRILLAEDDVMAQEMVVHFLTEYDVFVVRDGEAAVEAVCDQEFDLVLMDLRMPKLGGVAATKKIREIFSIDELPIMAMSGNAFSGDIEECLEVGMNDHLAKPVAKDELLQKVRLLLTERKQVNGGAHSKVLVVNGRLIDNGDLSFDLISMYSALGKNEKLLVRQLHYFSTEYEGFVGDVGDMCKSKDGVELSNYFHKLKSSASLLGVCDLAFCCEELEALMDEIGFKSVEDELGLQDMIATILNMLEPVLTSVKELLGMLGQNATVTEVKGEYS